MNRPVRRKVTVDLRWAAIAVLFIALIAGLTLVEIPAYDWQTFYNASQSLWEGRPLYGAPHDDSGELYYSNPPWLAAALIPLALLPFRLSWAVLTALTLLGAVALVEHVEGRRNLLKAILVLFSPPLLLIVWFGQVDVLVLSALMLPGWLRWLAATAKPQVAIGLLATPHWCPAMLVLAAAGSASLLILGWWPGDLLAQPFDIQHGAHNLWNALFPFNVIGALYLILVAWQRNDQHLYIAASPFLFPYATMGSLIGAWIIAIASLDNRRAVLFTALSWGVVVLL